MANQKKYNHPEAPENIDIKEEIQKMVSDFRAWLKKAKAKLDTKPTYVKVLVYGAIAAFTILLAYKAFVFFLAWFLFLAFMGVPTLTFLIPDKFKRQNKFAMRKSTNVAWMNIPIMYKSKKKSGVDAGKNDVDTTTKLKTSLHRCAN